MPTARIRIDRRAVELGLVRSREEIHELIDAGHVLVNGAVVEKASRLVGRGDAIVVTQRRRFVGRGGLKLEGVLSDLSLSVQGRHCLDLGSSTGGFIECLVSQGAASVVGVDVGRGQIHETVLALSGVTVFEGTDLRVFAQQWDGSYNFDLITGDLSFISLCHVAQEIGRLARSSDVNVLLLVKPQFEVGHREVSRGMGVVSDPDLWRQALSSVISAYRAVGLAPCAVRPSRLRGAQGNQEFFVLFRRRSGGGYQCSESVEPLVEQALCDVLSASGGDQEASALSPGDLV